MVSAISAVLAFMPPPPFTATDRLLGARPGAEYLLLMNVAADGSASPDRSPRFLATTSCRAWGSRHDRDLRDDPPATGRPSVRHRRAPPNRQERGLVTGWEGLLWERF